MRYQAQQKVTRSAARSGRVGEVRDTWQNTVFCSTESLFCRIPKQRRFRTTDEVIIAVGLRFNITTLMQINYDQVQRRELVEISINARGGSYKSVRNLDHESFFTMESLVENYQSPV